jgi:hypothetical protein
MKYNIYGMIKVFGEVFVCALSMVLFAVYVFFFFFFAGCCCIWYHLNQQESGPSAVCGICGTPAGTPAADHPELWHSGGGH